MKFQTVIAALFALLAAGGSVAQAQQSITITDTKQQSNFNGAIGAGQSAPIGAMAFDFSNQLQLLSVTSITLTLTVFDGNTGLGPNGVVDTPYPPPGDGTAFGDDEFDVNSLTLVLDNINLGPNFLLNGLDGRDLENPPSQADFITRTITGMPSESQMTALLAALQDGSLSAFILDSTGISQSNGLVVPGHDFNSSNPIFATLSLTGMPIPEPSTGVLLLSGAFAGAALLAGRRLRQSRRT